MKKGLLAIVFVFLIFFANSVSAEIIVSKTAPEKIELGKILPVSIQIKNNYGSEKIISVKETITGADPIDPKEFMSQKCPEGMICATPPYYLWNFTLSANSEKSILYKIKPLSLGNFYIGPTVITTSSGETFYSNSLFVSVHRPYNGICEPEKGENYYNTKDCPSGSDDGVCDLLQDNRCDPDCTPQESDPDCKLENVFSFNFVLYKNDSVSLKKFEIQNSYLTYYQNHPSDYNLKLLSRNNDVLFERNLQVQFNSEQSKSFELNLPFYNTAEMLKLYHNNFAIFSFNITKYFCKPNLVDEKCIDFCKGKGDPDCEFLRKRCGNGICDSGENNPKSEFYCPQDCEKPVKCGNNKCEVEFGENFKTCKIDCPSGSKDNYCDKVKDGICDSDCVKKGMEKEDPDCVIGRKGLPLWLYIIIGVFVIIILFVLFMSIRVKRK